jgi:predicted Ser/Thr protein kinase
MSENAASSGEVASPGQRPDPLIGQTLDGRYKIERVLGEGGMGIVYKGVHTTLGKSLAIKVLRPEVSKNEEIVQRFRQEAQSASQIGNPHIIDISDFGVLPDGSTYFVMEYLRGKSLTAALNERFSTERIIHVVRQLAGALGAAHEVGIVHRDLKPDNVQLIERGGHKDFVKVLDFGIAKVGGSTSKLTQAGQVFGTPHYMSPEQCAGSHVDQRTDIYAVGVMLYEMACGKVPFDAENLMGILTKHLYENPLPPSQVPDAAGISPALEAVILKCLQKKVEARYQTMAELSADLDAIEGGLAPRAQTMNRVERPTAAAAVGTLTGVEARVSLGAGEQDITIRKSRAPLFLGLGAGAAVVIAGLMFALGKPSTQSAAAGTPVVAPAQEQPQPTAAAKPAPTAPEPPPVVQLRIMSSPDNAEIFQDGALVGNAPYALNKPARGDKPLKLELRLPGYASREIEVSDQSNDVQVRLAKLEDKPAAVHPAAPAAPKRPRTTGSPPKEGQKPPRGPSQTEVLDPWN